MAKAARLAVAVLAGAAAWTVLWIGGTQLTQRIFPHIVISNQPLSHVGILLTYIGYSVALSLLAGYVAAAAAGGRPMPAVWVLALLQLALGMIAEVSYWSLLPVWYHVVFLILLVPATWYGGVLRARRAPAVIAAT